MNKDENVEAYILLMNFQELLTNYLEGRADLATVLKMGEIIYSRDPKTLSKPLITASKTLHELQETIKNTVTDIVLDLIDYQQSTKIK